MCTGIFEKSRHGDWVSARTMEFGSQVPPFQLLLISQEVPYISQLRPEEYGASWKTKYAHVGFSLDKSSVIIDGLNEQGLACGAFYFPGYAIYQPLLPEKKDSTISQLDFVSWVLGNFSTVEATLSALSHISIITATFEPWGTVPPLHYFLADKTGNRAIVEYVNGKVSLHDAPFGVITNAPTYDWHMTNLRNYIGLSPYNEHPLSFDKDRLIQFGEGSGALGLPGDFTPTSRFIRATFFNQTACPGENAAEQVDRAFKILNQFDIPKGIVRKREKETIFYENTHWTSASDLTNLRYYFHTYDTRAIRYVSLETLSGKTNTISCLSTDYDRPPHASLSAIRSGKF